MYLRPQTCFLLALSWSSCLLSLTRGQEDGRKSARIIGGSNANRATYPKSIVMLTNREQKLVCAGTLISPTLVITSGHCSRGILEEVVVGRYNRINPLEEFDVIPIVAERIHPKFETPALSFDIMIVQIERPTTIDVDYMQLNPLENMPPVGFELTAFGWGETQPNGSDTGGSPILQRANLNYISNEECNSKVNEEEDFRGKIFDNMMCTFAPDADHCYGDSGGPIVAISPNNPANVMQVAVISWGADECADGFFPGVNQRTSSSFEWIASWVCAIDGDDIDTMLPYNCDNDQTFSPAPTVAPVPFGTTLAPTAYKVSLWVQLFMDQWPGDIRWIVIDATTGVPVKNSPSYVGSTEDEIVEEVLVDPDTAYEFIITDEFGDGFQEGGFFQLSIGDSLESAEILTSGNFERTASHSFKTPLKPIVDQAESVCASVNESCNVFTDCCSQKCTLGKCMKTPRIGTTRAENTKVSLGGNRGGAGQGPLKAGARRRKLRQNHRG